jgi:hypothetical protein
MGFYDEVVCYHSLADPLGVQGSRFQTKMLGRGSEQYTITPGGRLLRHLFRRWVAKDDPGITSWVESSRIGEVDTEFHGDIVLYGHDQLGAAVEFVARFSHGVLKSLIPLSELNDARLEMLAILQGGC